MSRVKGGYTKRAAHKKVLKFTKGFRMSRNRLFKVAHEALLHAGQYSFVGRKLKKRDMRKLWTVRLQSALKTQENPVSYSRFINLLKIKGVILNRKSLSELATNHPQIFSKFFEFCTK